MRAKILLAGLVLVILLGSNLALAYDLTVTLSNYAEKIARGKTWSCDVTILNPS